MRQNPTAATGPVSIKHVRNTVPKALEPQTTVEKVKALKATRCVFAALADATQLEEPSL